MGSLGPFPDGSPETPILHPAGACFLTALWSSFHFGGVEPAYVRQTVGKSAASRAWLCLPAPPLSTSGTASAATPGSHQPSLCLWSRPPGTFHVDGIIQRVVWFCPRGAVFSGPIRVAGRVRVCAFAWLRNSPRCGRATFCISFCALMPIWTASAFPLLSSTGL